MHSIRRSRLPFWAAAAAALIVNCFLSATLAGADEKTVLVLYGTRADARISILGDRELPRRLERGLGQRVNHYSEHLDLARFRDAHYRSAVAAFLTQKYGSQHFDLVIAMHDVVLDFLGTTPETPFRDTPVVFFSDRPIAKPLPNSTGVVAENDLAPTVDLALTLQPVVRRVYVVTGADPADHVYERQARRQ